MSASRTSVGVVTLDIAWFRFVVLITLGASVWITWPLWNVRALPPLLPLLPLPEVSLGVPLLAACVATVFAPRGGAIVISALVAYGMATDQTRMQPEFFSLPLLLWASLPMPAARLIGRGYIISLWFYAGLHKLLSPDFAAGAGSHLLLGAGLPVSIQVAGFLATGAATVEMTIAIAAIIPATRTLASWGALLLHAGVILVLAAADQQRNLAVWPWNAALAMSGFALIAPWTTSALADLARSPLMPKSVVLFLLLAPLGYYAGIVDTYPAHNLYSSQTAAATVYCPRGCRPEQDVNATWHFLNVPLPPEPRLFVASFAKTCAPGDVLRIVDPHPPVWNGSHVEMMYHCPAGSLSPSHL